MARLKVNKIGQLLQIKELERELHVNHFHLLSWHLSGARSLCPRIRGRLEGTGPSVAFIYGGVFCCCCSFFRTWALLSSWQSIRFQLILWPSDAFFFLFLKSQLSYEAPSKRVNRYYKFSKILENCKMDIHGSNNAPPDSMSGSYNWTKHCFVFTFRILPEIHGLCLASESRNG